MRHNRFIRMTIEGFRSYGHSIDIALDNPGLNIIRGLNGAGKTTRFSALLWCLYKANLNETNNDKVQTWKELRPKGYRGTRVVVDFESNGVCYRVARHINFKGTTKGLKGDSRLMIFRNPDTFNFDAEDLVGDEHHKGDQQEYINRLLGMDSRAFLNSVLFGQRMQRLVTADNEEKRKLFDMLFELEFIERAKEKANTIKAELDIAVGKNKVIVDNNESNLTKLKEQFDEKKKLIDEFEDNKAARIKELKADIKTLEGREWDIKEERKTLMDSLTKDTKSNEELIKSEYEKSKDLFFSSRDYVNDLESTVKSTNRELETAKYNLQKYEKELEGVKDTCPYCNGKLKKEEVNKVKSNITGKITAEQNVIKVMTKSLKENEKSLEKVKVTLIAQEKDYKTKKEAYENRPRNPDDIQKDIDKLEVRLEGIEEQIQSKQKDIDKELASEPPKVNLTALTDSIDEAKKALERIQKKLNTDTAKLERVKWWISKGFNSSGIKAFVFSAMLNQLNVLVKKYASRLGYGVKFSMDMNKASKPFITECWVDDFKVDYNELSGGQKQRVDIALAFAMHDLISSKSDMNLLIMDEVFEGLDEVGIEEVFDLIRLKAGLGKSCYIITHSKLIDSLNAKTIFVEQDENKMSYVL